VEALQRFDEEFDLATSAHEGHVDRICAAEMGSSRYGKTSIPMP